MWRELARDRARTRESASERARARGGGVVGGAGWEQWPDRVAFGLQDLRQLRLVSILFDADYVDLHLFLTRTAQPEREREKEGMTRTQRVRKRE
jgi:hypothetical protein